MACSNANGCVGGGCKMCKSPREVFGRGGNIGTGTLWAVGDNPFQRICFSPPFTTGCNESVNCIDTIATEPGCVYDAECPTGTRCKDAECVPIRRTAAGTSGGSYGSYAVGNSNSIPAQNPRAMDSFTYNDPRILQVLPAPYNANLSEAQKFLAKTCPGTPGVFYTKATPDSQASVVCPVFPGHVKERNCMDCVQKLESCNMLSGFLSKEQYDQCLERQECFQYNIGLENGMVHPLGYKLTPKCVEVANKALAQCHHDCSPVETPYF